MRTKLHGLFIGLVLLATFAQTPTACAGVTFSVTPSVVSNTYNGYITLQIDGLTNTETVVIQKYLDINANGSIDANDWLVQQFDLTDGLPGMVIGGVTNFNVPGDTDGSANGQITAALNFYSQGGIQSIAGAYLYRLSSPGGHFTAMTTTLTVTNLPFPQTITGSVVSNGTSTTVFNAVVILFQPTPAGDTGPVNAQAGVVANNTGGYAFQMPAGTYAPLVLSSNYVYNYAASPMLTLAAGQTLTSNLTLTYATTSISGQVVDAADAGLGLPGVIELARTTADLLAFSFTDSNGNFNVPVTAGDWILGGAGLGLVVHGYVGWAGGTNVPAGATGVALAYPKATALFYGSVLDTHGNPLPGQSGVVEPESQDNNNLYYMEDYTDANGHYVVPALGGLANDPWIVKLDSDKRPANYALSLSQIEQEGGTNLSVGEAVLQNFTATLINSGLAQNGGFELPDFADWTLSGDISRTYEDDGSQSGIAFYPLEVGAALGSSGSLGSLSQSLSTTPGTSYVLSFWFDNPYGDPGEFFVSWNGNILFDSIDPDSGGWTNVQLLVSATGTSAALQFGFEDDVDNFGLDGVSVLPPFNCTTNAGDTLTIVGYNGPGGAMTIPATINGLAVTSIGNEAFDGASNLTSVMIPGGVTSIGAEAFENCTGLTNATLSLGLTSLGVGAFEDCSNLTSVMIPNSVTSMGAAAFENCVDLTNATLSTGLISIASDAFNDCVSLENVTIPNSVTSIGAEAFESCMDLTNATLSTGLTSIGPNAFNDCQSLGIVTIPGSVANIGAGAFADCYNLYSVFFVSNAPATDPSAFGDDNLTAYYLPGTSGWAAFYADTGVPVQDEFVYRAVAGGIAIESYYGPGGAVTIPASIDGLAVAGIDAGAFESEPLTSVTIPGGVTSIGDYAFNDCTSLAAITVDPSNSFYSSVNGVLFGQSQTLLMQYPPAAMAASYAMPDTVAGIEDGAFEYCANLTNVTISDGVSSIGNDAFYGCTSLIDVTIPASVTSLGAAVFSDCTDLTVIQVDATNSFYASVNGVLFDKSQTTLIQCPGGLGGSCVIPATVTSIANDAFLYCGGLTNVTIPGSVTNIGDLAFAFCRDLASVTLPGGVTSIGNNAFEYCSRLTSVTIPGGVTSLGQAEFYGCASLVSVTIPAGVTSIGYYAFAFCGNLSVYCEGNAPSFNFSLFTSGKGGATAMVYYLPGATGWSSTYAGVPAVELAGIAVTANPTNGLVPLPVNFTAAAVDSAGHAVTNWTWNFGDGVTSATQSPSHTYSYAGSFAAALMETNNRGVLVAGAAATIRDAALTIAFATTNPKSSTVGVVPFTLAFTSAAVDSEGNPITHWNWTFGDGSASTNQNPSHNYTIPGTFLLALMATNSLGGTAAGVGPDSVTAEPGPVSSGLVQNGGFETGDFTGWNLSGDESYAYVDNGSQSGITPYAGNYEAALGTSGSLGFLSQSLSTVAGGNYVLSFWLANPDADPEEFAVSWNGSTVLDTINPVARGWTNVQFAVAATATNTVLEFAFEDDADYFGLDNVSVVATHPVPRVTSLSLSGTTLVLNGVNGPSTGAYSVLMGTNLTQPFSQWTPVPANVVSANGNFTITVSNTVSHGVPQRFYILQTP